jgi:hypothetical protein
MQFQVPQFIETEDKVVGPFSIRQFIYVAVAGGFSFMLYFSVDIWLFASLSVVILGAALSFAFIKVNGVPLTRVVFAAFSFYWKPQTYIWQPDHPEIAKGLESLRPAAAAGGVSLESIVSGIALRNTWQSLQTGTKVSTQQFLGKIEGRYQIFQKMTGERRAARRIDYR